MPVKKISPDQMSFLEDSPAQTSPSQESRRESQPKPVRDSGLNLPVLLGNFDPVSCSLKMYLPLLPMEERLSLVSLPRWGMMRNGALYQLQPLALLTAENDGTAWPTPKARDYQQGGFEAEMRRKSPALPAMV